MSDIQFNHQPLYQVGDILKIKSAEDMPNSVKFGWMDTMDYLFGEQFTVHSITPFVSSADNLTGEPSYRSVEGIENKDYGGYWYISEDMLEFVSRPREEIEIASDEEFELLLG